MHESPLWHVKGATTASDNFFNKWAGGKNSDICGIRLDDSEQCKCGSEGAVRYDNTAIPPWEIN